LVCELEDELKDARAEIARLRESAFDGCPCRHTTPCDEMCTCVKAHSSRGCARCCSYGSPEQQREMADRLCESARRWMVPSLIVREVSDHSEVYRVETTEAQYERVLAWILSNLMNTDDYYVDDSEFDDAD
jgi:hypothetical protein